MPAVRPPALASQQTAPFSVSGRIQVSGMIVQSCRLLRKNAADAPTTFSLREAKLNPRGQKEAAPPPSLRLHLARDFLSEGRSRVRPVRFSTFPGSVSFVRAGKPCRTLRPSVSSPRAGSGQCCTRWEEGSASPNAQRASWDGGRHAGAHMLRSGSQGSPSQRSGHFYPLHGAYDALPKKFLPSESVLVMG